MLLVVWRRVFGRWIAWLRRCSSICVLFGVLVLIQDIAVEFKISRKRLAAVL